MKFLIHTVTVLTLLLATSCSQKQQKDPEQLSTGLVENSATASPNGTDTSMTPVMSFTEETHDFGKITQGEKVSHAFRFKNTGKADLVISSAQGSCGCTVPEYPKNPIPADGEGSIDVVFDSANKSGKTEKTVTLVTNARPNTKVLVIKADIIVPEGNNQTIN